MTITNTKETPVKFDSKKHYPRNAPMMKGRTWTMKLDGDGNPKKNYEETMIRSTPDEYLGMYVSRLRDNHNLGEWVQE